MLDGLEGWHIVLIVLVAALLFGSGKLPGAARSIGQSLRIFKSELKAGAQDDDAKAAVVTAAAAGPVSAPAAVAPQVVQSSDVYTPSPAPVASTIPAPAPQPADAQPVISRHTAV